MRVSFNAWSLVSSVKFSTCFLYVCFKIKMLNSKNSTEPNPTKLKYDRCLWSQSINTNVRVGQQPILGNVEPNNMTIFKTM